MPNEKMQPKMKPDEVAANLALATHISQQMMPQAPQEQPVETPETPQDAPGEPEAPQPEETPEKEAPQEENQEIQKLTKDFDEFKGKIEGVIDTKFSELTKTIKDAISSD